MNLLTGAPSKYIPFSEYDNKLDKLFDMISSCHFKHFLITTSTGNNEGYNENQIM